METSISLEQKLKTKNKTKDKKSKQKQRKLELIYNGMRLAERFWIYSSLHTAPKCVVVVSQVRDTKIPVSHELVGSKLTKKRR